jgi:alkylation response protein AidB-like acyl-CoA dehydrogenase
MRDGAQLHLQDRLADGPAGPARDQRHGLDLQLPANRLCCEAADRAMQVHGGIGYSRAMPFEHIYRHHRRYRITEGSEEVQMRRVAQYLFGFAGKHASA